MKESTDPCECCLDKGKCNPMTCVPHKEAYMSFHGISTAKDAVKEKRIDFSCVDPEIQFDAGVCCDCDDNDKCTFEPAGMKALRKRQKMNVELVSKMIGHYLDSAVNSKIIDKYSRTDNVFVVKPTQTDEIVKIRIGNENTELKIRQIIKRANERMDRFLLATNKVTAYHRHGNPIPKDALDNLSNQQIEMEQLLKENEQV